MVIILTHLFLSDTFLHQYPLDVFRTLRSKTLDDLKSGRLILPKMVFEETFTNTMKSVDSKDSPFIVTGCVSQ